jgi:hypothetical protein
MRQRYSLLLWGTIKCDKTGKKIGVLGKKTIFKVSFLTFASICTATG